MILFREQKTLENKLKRIHVNRLSFSKKKPWKNIKDCSNLLTVLCPERILDTEANFNVFSLLLETQIRVDSSCVEHKRNFNKYG